MRLFTSDDMMRHTEINKMSNAGSDLFELINFFVLGNYQGAINEGVSFGSGQLREGDLVLRDFYVYRSYIAQGNYGLVISEIKDNAPATLQVILRSFFVTRHGLKRKRSSSFWPLLCQKKRQEMPLSLT